MGKKSRQALLNGVLKTTSLVCIRGTNGGVYAPIFTGFLMVFTLVWSMRFFEPDVLTPNLSSVMP